MKTLTSFTEVGSVRQIPEDFGFKFHSIDSGLSENRLPVVFRLLLIGIKDVLYCNNKEACYGSYL